MRLSDSGTRLQHWGIRGCVLVLLIVAVSVYRVWNVLRRANDIPVSPLTARGQVGQAYLDHHDIATTGPIQGEIDDFGTLAYPGFDPDDVHPAIRRFYEQTAEYTLRYAVVWHSGFRLGAALASRLTTLIGQLNLPGPGSHHSSPRYLQNRLVGIDSKSDPRHGARAWIRTDVETDEGVFVAIYATHRRNDITYVNIAAPLPWSNLSTVLHVDTIPIDGKYDGLELTTTTETGDEGLYLVTPVGTVPLPLDQTFRISPADAGDDTDIVATHEMWVCGRTFLTVSYAGFQKPSRCT